MDFGIKAIVFGVVMWVTSLTARLANLDWQYVNDVTSSVLNIVATTSILIGASWKIWKWYKELKNNFDN